MKTKLKYIGNLTYLIKNDKLGDMKRLGYMKEMTLDDTKISWGCSLDAGLVIHRVLLCV